MSLRRIFETTLKRFGKPEDTESLKLKEKPTKKPKEKDNNAKKNWKEPNSKPKRRKPDSRKKTVEYRCKPQPQECPQQRRKPNLAEEEA